MATTQTQKESAMCPTCKAPPVIIHHADCPSANRAQRLGTPSDHQRLAGELEARADARNYYGDYREAAELRARAEAVREGKLDRALGEGRR